MESGSSKFVSARVSPSSPLDRKAIIGRSLNGSFENIQELISEVKKEEMLSRSDLIAKRIKEAEHSYEIILDGLRLKFVPEEVFSLTSTVKLHLHDNELVVLPPELRCLSKLKDISIENNNLTSLPKEIGSISSVERLHCHGNKIVSLPSEIGLLSNLTRLFLSDNKIATLPPEIGYLSNLQWLSLDNNQLSSLPSEIGQLSKLGWCSLESNQIASLPPEMGQLYSLEFLSLVDNPIAHIPESLTQLNLLKDVRTNATLTIPPEVVETRNGRTILQFLTDVIARWDLDLEERAHWVPNEYSLKCCKCNIPFTFTKRRHHCRLCGLLFCNKDCDQVCSVPGMQTPGRVCVTCYDIIDPLHPSNLYIQHCVARAEKEANKYYGLAEGEENLPLSERKAKILEQLKEVSETLHQAHNAQDGLKRLVDVYKAAGDNEQMQATSLEIEEGEQKLLELDETKQKLSTLLRELDEEDGN